MMTDRMQKKREKLLKALNKPDCVDNNDVGDDDFFNPWEDVIEGIFGCYCSGMDQIFIRSFEAVRDGKNFELIQKGYEYEFALYVLAGQYYTDYGTSPRVGWPDSWCDDLWDKIIEKWKAYFKAQWGADYEDADND